MSAIERLAQIERRGRAMRTFTEQVRERGGVAVVEKQIDLPRLRAQWRRLHCQIYRFGRLSDLGPTPVDQARVAALRQQIARARS